MPPPGAFKHAKVHDDFVVRNPSSMAHIRHLAERRLLALPGGRHVNESIHGPPGAVRCAPRRGLAETATFLVA
jgi:hypothetical protein